MKEDTSLGASEFSATLNGDNPQAILRVLKQFAKTVHKERRWALSIDDDDDVEASDDAGDDDSSDEEEEEGGDDQPSPKKKLKKTEEWKQDTNAYHVPFVGTSVAKGTVAEVVKGEWPTGLLKAYLTNSPLAMELTSDDLLPPEGQIHKSLIRRKRGKLSRAIYKAYLKALAELVTVAIPVSKLQDESSHITTENDVVMAEVPTDSIYSKFLPLLLKTRLAGMVKLLSDETDRGRGKQVYGGCGSLAAPALKLLQKICQISTANARLVSRYLDEELPDGVLRALLRPAPVRTQSSEEGDDDKKKRLLTKPARVEAINLATTLIQAEDSAVATYICTSGSREHKVKPGILFIAFREGLATHQQSSGVDETNDDNYLDSVADMLSCVRLLLWNRSRIVSPKQLAEMVSRDPLNNLCQFAAHAPPLTSDKPYQTVLNCIDSYEDLDALLNAGIEARRLLFPLLCDSSGSPLLRDIRSSKSNVQQLVRTLIRLFQTPNGGIQMRLFLVHCVEKTPSLLPNLFRVLTFPEAKKTYDFVSHLNIVSLLLRKGPSPLACLPPAQQEEIDIDEVLLMILPAKLRRHPMGKAMQSGNALVVLECLKLVKFALDRFQLLKREILQQPQQSEHRVDRLSAAFAQWLPDLQILLAVRSRFDAFSGSKSNILISDCLYRVLESFSLVLPTVIRETSFDWMKLLPSAEKFFQAVPLVQRRVLKTLQLIIKTCKGQPNNFLNSCKTILEIMLVTKCRIVHQMSREIALSLLIPVMQSRSSGDDSFECIEHESSCWINALTLECLPAFCKLLPEVSAKALTILASVGPAWGKRGISRRTDFSILLMASLSARDESKAFSLFVLQVTARCLLFQRNPIPLAELIRYVGKKDDSSRVMNSKAAAPLVKYASALLDFESDSGSGRLALLGEMLNSYFSGSDRLATANKLLFESPSLTEEDLIDQFEVPQTSEKSLELAKFLIHVQLISEGTQMKSTRCWALLRRTVPTMLLLATNKEDNLDSLIFKDVYSMKGKKPCNHFDILDLLLTSCPFASHFDSVRLRIEDTTSSLYSSTSEGNEDMLSSEEQRSALLRLSLLGQLLPDNSIAKVKLSLLSDFMADDEYTSSTMLRLVLSFTKCTGQAGVDANYDPDVLRQIFQAWWSLSDPKLKLSKTPLGQRIRTHFSFLLTKVLMKTGLQATMLVALMNEQAENEIVVRCLASVPEAIGEGSLRPYDEDVGFLEAILKSDPLRFSPPFLAKFSQGVLGVSKVWNSGALDEATLFVLRRQSKVTSDEEDSYRELGSSIASRAVSSLSIIVNGDGELDEATSLFELTIEALYFLRISDCVDGLSHIVLDLLSSTLEQSKQLLRNAAATKLCKLGMVLTSHSALEDKPSVKKRLAGTLFALLCEWLPHTYKHQGAADLDHITVLTWLVSLLQDVDEFDIEILKGMKPSLIQKAFRSCLKHGISESTEDSEGSAMSLKLVRLLLVRMFGSQSQRQMLKEYLPKPSPAEVFAMLTSHSKFPLMLSRSVEHVKTPKGGCDRLELVRLMLCCVILSPNEIAIESSTWTALYSAFSAGLGELDTAIRQIFSASCTLQSQAVHVPFLDEFRWKGCLDSQSREASRLDWFLDALDTNRIRDTVSHYPLHDRMYLDVGIDGGEDKSGEAMEVDDSDEESDDEQSDGDDVIGNANTTAAGARVVVNGLSAGAVWDRDTPDMRYSPAFLLPFILGALESGLIDCDPEAKMGASAGSEELESKTFQYKDSFVSIARRLCEKGSLALCFASLSSRCEKVRGFAISILGLLLRACATSEARGLSSWRERPQLAMLLNSVQRAFVVKQASIASSGSVLGILVLSPVVSTFLARASLSISKPDDALYVPLNRHFLKTEAEHGAFQDMSRLPGFISLFCSSSDDPVQSRKERLWALQLLRDGFLDPSCYRLVASCHAPELILTSFENIRLSQFSEDMKGTECSLILEVIKTFVEYGGSRAAYHIVGKIGLLSWMRSLCVSRPLVESLPTIKARISFCDLVCSAVKAVSMNERLRSDTLVHEVCGLAEPVLNLAFENDSSEKSDPLLIGAVCLALESLETTLSSLTKDGLEHPDTHPIGIGLSSGLRFLKMAPPVCLGMAVHSLSNLPVFIDGPTSEEAGELCSVLLGSCQTNATFDDDESFIQSVLERVVLIANHFGGSLGSDCGALHILLAFRSRFVSTEPNYWLWLECLELLTLNAEENSLEATIARDMLHSRFIDDNKDT